MIQALMIKYEYNQGGQNEAFEGGETGRLP